MSLLLCRHLHILQHSLYEQWGLVVWTRLLQRWLRFLHAYEDVQVADEDADARQDH